MKPLIFIFMLLLSTPTFANDHILKGRILAYGINGEEAPLPDVEVSVLYRNVNPSTTNERGEFVLNFDKYLSKKGNILIPGGKINLFIKDPGWEIVTPYQGEFYLPKELDSEHLTIRVVANNSELPIGSLNAKFTARNPSERDTAPQYTVQVFNTNDKNKASAIKSEFEARNYSPFVSESFENKQIVYRVFIGKFISFSEAEKNRDIIAFSYGYGDSFVRPLSK